MKSKAFDEVARKTWGLQRETSFVHLDNCVRFGGSFIGSVRMASPYRSFGRERMVREKKESKKGQS